MLPWRIEGFHAAQSAEQNAQTFQQLNAACEAYALAYRMRDTYRCAWIAREFRRCGLYIMERDGRLIWEYVGDPRTEPRRTVGLIR